MKIICNCMVRDEPFVFFALTSVAPFCDEVLVYDTGSTDKTRDHIELAKKEFDNIKPHYVDLPNGHAWSLLNLENRYSNPGFNELGDLRRKMHAESDGDFIWILDGDEVYTDSLARNVREHAKANLHGNICGFVPVIDFCDNLFTIHNRHHMGRIFKKKNVEIVDGYPGEMHREIGSNKDLELNSPKTMLIDGEPMHHHELLTKPWRRNPYNKAPFYGPWPEVYTRYSKLAKEQLTQWTK